MAVLPSLIQEWEDSWGETIEYVGDNWNNFIGGDTWSMLSPLQQAELSAILVYLETWDTQNQNIVNQIKDLIDQGIPIEGYEFDIDSAVSYTGNYKTSETGSALFPCTLLTEGGGDYKAVVAKSKHFNMELALYSYRIGQTTYEDVDELPEGITTSIVDNMTSGGTGGITFKGVRETGYPLTDFRCIFHDTKGFFADKLTGTATSGWQVSLGASNIIPTHTRGAALASNNIICGVARTITIPAQQVPADQPWIGYNDTVLPEIKNIIDNELPFIDPQFWKDLVPYYPDGYNGEEEEPKDPTEEEDLPHFDGDEPINNFNGLIPSPSRFITQYILTAGELDALGSALWNAFLDPNKTIWENFACKIGLQADTGTFNISAAMELIVSLRVFPFTITQVSSTSFEVVDGLTMGTGHTKFIDSDMLTLIELASPLSVGECDCRPAGEDYDKDFRNYANCTVSAYLPYCGTVELNPAEVMFTHLTCKYLIDWQSGQCTGLIIGEGGYPVASKSGQIGFVVPINATNAGSVAGQLTSDALSVISMGGNLLLGLARSLEKANDPRSNPVYNELDIKQLDFSTALGMVGKANDMFSRSGIGISSLSGGAGASSILAYKTPFLIIRRGVSKLPGNFGHTVGYRTRKTGKLSDFPGYVECINVDVSGIAGAEEGEKALIKRLLEAGVYV